MPASSKDNPWVLVSKVKRSGGVTVRKVSTKDLKTAKPHSRPSVLDPALPRELEKAFIAAVQEAKHGVQGAPKRVRRR